MSESNLLWAALKGGEVKGFECVCGAKEATVEFAVNGPLGIKLLRSRCNACGESVERSYESPCGACDYASLRIEGELYVERCRRCRRLRATPLLPRA